MQVHAAQPHRSVRAPTCSLLALKNTASLCWQLGHVTSCVLGRVGSLATSCGVRARVRASADCQESREWCALVGNVVLHA
jgi:hypothetical protein